MKTTLSSLLAVGLLSALVALPAAAQQTLGVYVVNQGNFGSANGSVTFYDPATGQTTDVLGNLDTIQSVEVFNEIVYVVVNVGGSIERLDAITHQRQPSIIGLVNPRYLAFASETKAYVTNQVFRFGGVTDKSFISVIDLDAGTVRDTLQVPGQPDHIVVAGTRAYVALGFFAETSLVGVIDVETDALVDVIDVGCVAPRFLVVDEEDEVHVVCNGTVDFNTGAETPGAIVTLDGATGEILRRIEATTLLAPNAFAIGTGQEATYSSVRQRAFVVAKENILVLDTSTNTLADTLEVAGGDLINALAYDDASDRLYVTRHDGSFTTAGRVEAYPATGSSPVVTFDVAVLPVHIAFFQEGLTTTVESAGDGVPERVGLRANYPNPFTTRTTLPFDVAQAGAVTLKVYDLLGREVATLVDAPLAPGYYEATWETEGQAAGVYLGRLQAAGTVSTRRLVRTR